ncbi:HEAT repeat domain-containing protein [Streptomyces sp. NPDC006733]|uniref:HEAT repeat domain-containing protein n=1 Tax=Streptomyces sp. NPDC006733 TaxID=3155460 RepID=UPI0033C413DA
MTAPTASTPRTTAVLLLLDLPRYLSRHDGAELTRALNELAGSPELSTTGPRWWSAFDEHARHVGRLRLDATSPEAPQGLHPGWEWALAVCAADGRTRQRALAAEALPLGEHPLLPLLVVRCSDWAEPVRATARAALVQVLAHSGPAELARAAAMAWSCEERQRGEDAVRLVADHLTEAPPELWQRLFTDPDHRIRRRALSAAIALDRCDTPRLLRLATRDPDAVVARSAAEHLLGSLVPPGAAAPVTPGAEAVLRRLLASRASAVRAVTVTVLRRARRPDLAEPFTADRSRQVREIARWVLRSHGQDPAAVCRARLARPGAEITPGAIAGLAECGDAGPADAADLLRPHLTHRRPAVRAAVLQALGTMRPPAVTTAELLTVMERDPASRVLRAAGPLVEAAASSVPRRRLEDLLAPGRPAPLRAQAARIIRATGTWERLEIDLRLLHDADPELAAAARCDIQAWGRSASTRYARPTDGRRQVFLALLPAAATVLDDWDLRPIRSLLDRPGTR